MKRKMNRQKKSERFYFMLSEDLKNRLYTAAENTGTAASELVRTAIVKELNKHHSKEQ